MDKHEQLVEWVRKHGSNDIQPIGDALERLQAELAEARAENGRYKTALRKLDHDVRDNFIPLEGVVQVPLIHEFLDDLSKITEEALTAPAREPSLARLADEIGKAEDK